MARNTDTLGL